MLNKEQARSGSQVTYNLTSLQLNASRPQPGPDRSLRVRYPTINAPIRKRNVPVQTTTVYSQRLFSQSNSNVPRPVQAGRHTLFWLVAESIRVEHPFVWNGKTSGDSVRSFMISFSLCATRRASFPLSAPLSSNSWYRGCCGFDVRPGERLLRTASTSSRARVQLRLPAVRSLPLTKD